MLATNCLLLTAFCLLLLPVTILLSIQRRSGGFRVNVENIFPAPGVRVRSIVARAKVPVGFPAHRIYRNPAQVDLVLWNERVALLGGTLPATQSATSQLLLLGRGKRNHVHSFNQRIEIRRVAIRIVGRKDGLVGDSHPHTRVGEDIRRLRVWIWSGIWIRIAALLLINLQLGTGQRLSMKLIDGLAHCAQSLVQILFFLTLAGYLSEWNYAESQDGHHGDRDHQLDQREATGATSGRDSWFKSSAHVTELPTRSRPSARRRVILDWPDAKRRQLLRAQSQSSRGCLSFAPHRS